MQSTITKLLEQYAQGERKFTRLKLLEAEIIKATLINTDFSGSDLRLSAPTLPPSISIGIE